jgi:hypothetical protein
VVAVPLGTATTSISKTTATSRAFIATCYSS